MHQEKATNEECKQALDEALKHAFAAQRALNINHGRCFAARQALARFIATVETQQEMN